MSLLWWMMDKVVDGLSSKGEPYSFKDYHETAKIIQKSPDFKNSFAKNLENFLLGKEHNLEFPSDNVDPAGCYIRLAAPNLDGKTQLPFLFEEIKPICFNACYSERRTNYSFFKTNKDQFEWKSELTKAIYEDYLAVRYPNKMYSESDYECKAKMEFSVLDELLLVYSCLNIPMSSTKPATCIEVKDLLKGFVLFVDGEFILDSLQAIILKNLAKAVGIALITVETTASPEKFYYCKMKNYHQQQPWALIVTKLDPVYLEVLDAKYNYSESLQKFMQGRHEDDPLKQFLLEFNIKDYRPGVALMIAKAFKRYAACASNFTLGIFLHLMTIELLEQFGKIKPCLKKYFDNMYSHLHLLHAYAYDDQNNGKIIGGSMNSPINSTRHLFYLKNPSDDKNYFVVYPENPEAGDFESIVQVYRNKRLVSWKSPMAVFNHKELLLMLSCLFIEPLASVARLCEHSREVDRHSAYSILDSKPAKRFRLPPLDLEPAECAVVMVRASHYQLIGNSPYFSLRGPSGLDYLQNVFCELIKYRKGALNIRLPEELDTRLEAIQVPFLYRLQNKPMAFEKFSSPGSAFFVACYNVGKEDDLIEGSFKAIVLEQRRQIIIANEIKNVRACLTAKDLLRTLRNFKLYKVHTGFVICPFLISSVAEDSEMAKFCRVNKINVYRTKILSLGTSFSLVPFFISCENPAMVCIVLESLRINK